jgi:drug/metabolite transporter (DMT)-like permease
MRGGRYAGAGLVALAATLWGAWPLVIRPSGLTGLQVALVSMSVMSLPLPFVLRRGAFADRGAVVALVGLGLADAGSSGLLFMAIARGPVAVAVLTHYLTPILVTLAAPFVVHLTGEAARSRRARVAAPLSLLGLALLVWRPGGEVPLATAGLGAASAVFYAAFVFLAQRAGRAFSPFALVSLHAVVSGAVLLAVSGGDALPPVGPGLAWAAGGAVICGALAASLFFKGVGLVPAAVAGALTYLEPLTGAVIGWVAFGEAIGPVGAAGGLLVLACGVWVATEPRRGPAPAGVG